jgi:hypothetical protein
MDNAHREVDPASFSFRWTPHNNQAADANALIGGSGVSITQLPRYGVGTTGDYWLRDLKARDKNLTASLTAFSGMRPDRGVRTHTRHSIADRGGPGPGLATEFSWTRTTAPGRHAVIRLHLRNVRSLRLLLRAAGFRAGEAGRLRIITDGPVRIHLGDRTIRVRGHGRIGVPFNA